MQKATGQHTEQPAAAAFSRQSAHFDRQYAGNSIIRYKRERVRTHLQQYLQPASNILELNSGTGEDAVWLAQQGHAVHATDISAGMQAALKEKVNTAGLNAHISTQLISYTALDMLPGNEQYDAIFSNFAGLNCTADLGKVLQSFDPILKPGGLVTLVLLPKFCTWEFLLLFRGKFKTAFRRFFSSKGSPAQLEGIRFNCYYYQRSFVRRQLKNRYDHLSTEGLCTIVPPSYIEGFAEKYPGWYAFLQKKENQLKAKWPWKSTGDYYIISFRKKQPAGNSFSTGAATIG